MNEKIRVISVKLVAKILRLPSRNSAGPDSKLTVGGGAQNDKKSRGLSIENQ